MNGETSPSIVGGLINSLPVDFLYIQKPTCLIHGRNHPYTSPQDITRNLTPSSLILSLCDTKHFIIKKPLTEYPPTNPRGPQERLARGGLCDFISNTWRNPRISIVRRRLYLISLVGEHLLYCRRPKNWLYGGIIDVNLIVEYRRWHRIPASSRSLAPFAPSTCQTLTSLAFCFPLHFCINACSSQIAIKGHCAET